MRKLALTVLSAAAALAGAASARTIDVAEILAANGGAVDGTFVDLGDVAIRYSSPEPEFSADLARSGGDFRRAVETRAAKAVGRPVYIEIILKSASKISNFNFSNNARGTVLVGGKSYSFADVGDLALKAPVIVVKSRGDRPLALESFDVAALETPLPGAGILMIAGIAGIGFAMSRRKRV